MDLDVTDAQLNDFLNGRKLVQEAFPQLTAAQREFILTGITEDEWATQLADPDEDEDAMNVPEEEGAD